jgi:hypothetical protein
MALISENGNWHGFICNDGSPKSITRLDFGSNPTSTPTATNLGNPGGILAGPRGLALWVECDGIRGLLADNQNSTLLDMKFPAGATGSITLTPAVTQPTLNYPQTIVRFREGNDMNTYIVNVMSNSMARIKSPTCISVNSSTLQSPAAFSFPWNGTYTIYLNANEGTYNNAQACKKVIVLPTPNIASNSPTICLGESVVLTANGANNYTWSTGATTPTITVTPGATGANTYTFSGSNGPCIAKSAANVIVYNCVGFTELSVAPSLKAYPNPTTGKINITTDQKIHLQIFNNAGACVYESEFKEGTTNNESLQDLASGLYLLKAVSERGTSYLKLLKE